MTTAINLGIYHDAGFSTTQIRTLESFLESNPLHWITLFEQGIYELILDNQMLSTFRQCPAYFVEAYINGYIPKGEGARSWALDFGILFHKLIEVYYQEFRSSSFKLNEWGINRAVEEWNKAKMDFHSEHKEYKMLGGVQGFCGMLLAYGTRFAAENERLRIIGTEISFGKAKEVFLGSVITQGITTDTDGPKGLELNGVWLQCYLSGRIDVLADDGNSIMPVDHKTMASFRFDPTMRFELDEGPTGYIFAVNAILKSYLESKGIDPSTLKRSCNKILMNFISKTIPKEGERFKRLPIMKTTEQLELYRLRMLATGEDLFRALVRYANTGISSRDTSKCNNWYMRDCTYLGPHRQNSKTNEMVFLNTFFEKAPIWNTETVGQE